MKKKVEEIIKQPKLAFELFNTLEEAEKRYNELAAQDKSVYYNKCGEYYEVSWEIK